MNEIKLNPIERVMRSKIQHYNPQKFWKRRTALVQNNRIPKIIKLYYLYYVKKCEAFNNSTTGIHIGFGASFETVPNLPHGLYGIVVSHNAKIGKNATIFHQVTIGEGKNGAPQIGDNVVIGAGAKLFGNIKIGNNCKIGGGAVVTFDVPDNCVVKAAKGTIVERI